MNSPAALIIDQCWTAEGNILSADPVWYNGGKTFGAGWYRVKYVKGAMKYNSNYGWSVAAYQTYKTNWQIITSQHNIVIDLVGAPAIAGMPGPSIPNHSFSGSGYDTQEACENANLSAGAVDFFHNGGPLGLILYDSPYNDNVHGSPDPTWNICSLKVPPAVPPVGCDNLILFSTGIGASGPLAGGQVEPHWTLISQPNPDILNKIKQIPGSISSIVYVQANPIPYGWPINTNDSQWIGPKSVGQYVSQPGQYIYRYILDLTGYDPTTVKLDGSWAVDNLGIDIRINDISTGQSTKLVADFESASFSIASGFINGINNIDFVCQNTTAQSSPTAFRVNWANGVGCKAAPVPQVSSGSGTEVNTATSSSGGCVNEDPQTGLMLAKHKAMLDSLPSHPGGFGFVFEQGRYLTQQDGVDSILTGDIQFVSDSLDITCGIDQSAGFPQTVFTFSIGSNFLNTFCLEIPGQKGKKGDKGDKGPAGRNGTGDGPAGDPGPDGIDATTNDVFTGITIIDLDDIYNTAVVSLNLDPQAAVLEVVKAPVAVPENDAAAQMVAATPIYRDVTFPSVASMDGWQLFAPPSDSVAQTTRTPDIDIIKLPDGWNGSEVGVVTMKLTQLIKMMVKYHSDLAASVILDWDRQIKEYVGSKDQTARSIIADLAMELTEAAWSAPLQFTIDIDALKCVPPGTPEATDND